MYGSKVDGLYIQRKRIEICFYNRYLEPPIFPAFLLLLPITTPFPLNVLPPLVPSDVGEITWITGTVLFVFVVADEDDEIIFKGLEVVEIVIRFGVEAPRAFVVGDSVEAAFAKRDPVRLLKAGTVVNCIVGAVEDICVIILAYFDFKNDWQI